MILSASAGLRRASAADIPKVTALQQAAYARNKPVLGVEPLPLKANYSDILTEYEVWLAEGANGLEGVLVIKPRSGDLLIWSVATAPQVQRRGLGSRLLAAAEARGRELGRRCVRL